MKLYAARHAYAGPAAKDPQKERERELTDAGADIATAIAKEMASQGEVPNVIFASPFVRAQQTADIYGKVLGVRVNIIDDIAPNRPMDDRLIELMSHGELRKFMIVGHHDNTTPMFNAFGGKMAGEKRDDDDYLRDALGYADGTTPSAGAKPGDGADPNDGGKPGDWVPLVMAEVRRIRIDRDTGEWKVRWRLRPSDIGLKDY